MIPARILNQLHYVKVADPFLDLQYFPNFLIIGPQRTGTTWLYENLSFHPQIKMSVPKEIFFFSNLDRPKNPKFRSDKLDWYLSFFRDPPTSKHWQDRQLSCLVQFKEPYQPIVRGEATASYAVLDEKILHDIALLNPHLRIIMLLRNPIDRAWSHAKKDLATKKGRRVEEITKRDFENFVTRPYQARCAQYIQNIDRWLSYFDERLLFIGWFDDIQRQPVKLLLEVMTFLGVNSDRKYVSPNVTKLVNPTEPTPIPSAWKKFLAVLLKEDLRKLEERFGICWC